MTVFICLTLGDVKETIRPKPFTTGNVDIQQSLVTGTVTRFIQTFFSGASEVTIGCEAMIRNPTVRCVVVQIHSLLTESHTWKEILFCNLRSNLCIDTEVKELDNKTIHDYNRENQPTKQDDEPESRFKSFSNKHFSKTMYCKSIDIFVDLLFDDTSS